LSSKALAPTLSTGVERNVDEKNYLQIAVFFAGLVSVRED